MNSEQKNDSALGWALVLNQASDLSFDVALVASFRDRNSLTVLRQGRIKPSPANERPTNTPWSKFDSGDVLYNLIT